MANQKMIRFLLDQEDAIKLEAEARKLGLSVSAFIRLLIKQWSDGIKFEREKVELVKAEPSKVKYVGRQPS